MEAHPALISVHRPQQQKMELNQLGDQVELNQLGDQVELLRNQVEE